MTNLCDFFQNIWVLNEVLSLNAQESGRTWFLPSRMSFLNEVLSLNAQEFPSLPPIT